MPRGYILIFYWTVVAVGGALFLGTAAALLRYRRTGAFPGQEEHGREDVPTRTESRRVALRCGLGFGLAAAGVVGLATTG